MNPIQRKRLRVSTVSLMYSEERSVAENIDVAVEQLESAAAQSPDLVCLPELFPDFGIPIEAALPVAECIPGPLTDRLGEIAKQYGTWIAGGTFSKDDVGYRNSMFLIDDDGGLFGVYHKMFPTTGELAAGVVPGEVVKVFDTPWGPIGAAICFDMNFDEIMNGLGENNARLVLFPSFYHAGVHNTVRAIQNQYYLASAQVTGEGQPAGFVVDPLGRWLTEGRHDQPNVSAEIGLDFVVAHTNWNEEQIETMAGDLGTGVSIERLQNEENLLLTSYIPDRSAGALAEEFRIELKTDYLERARELRRRSPEYRQ
jgi:predicted amidohydrolase